MNKFFSVDAEFSGLDFRSDCIISIGIVEVVQDNGVYTVAPERHFYSEIKPITNHYNEDSMKINGLDFEELSKSGPDGKEVAEHIKQFLNLGSGDTAVFVAYCGVLDKIFTDALFMHFDIESPFNYEIIEISSLAIGKLGFEWGFSEADLEKKIGLQPMSEDKKHNALEDAIHQAQEFCAIMNYDGNRVKKRLSARG